MTCYVLSGVMTMPVHAHGDLHGQIETISAELAVTPNNGGLYRRRGDLHRVHADWEAAAADYQRAWQLDPMDTEIHWSRAQLALAVGNDRDALVELEQFLAVRTEHSAAFAARAQAKFQLGDPEGAAADYSRALETTSSPDPDHYLRRAVALEKVGPAQALQAIAGLDEGIQRLGHLPALVNQALKIEIQLKRYPQALARVAEMRSHATRPEVWLERQGDIQLLAGSPQEAHASYLQGLELLRKDPAGPRRNGLTLQLQNRLSGKLHTTAPRAGTGNPE